MQRRSVDQAIPRSWDLLSVRVYSRGVATERQRSRCRERLQRLSDSTQDCESIQREAIAHLQRVLGFDRWCWPFADPDTLLPLSGVAEHDYGPNLRRALELEFSGNDFAAKHVLARRASPAGSLSSETGGDLARSPRWDEVMRPVGIGDVASVACRDALGCWGWIEVYRDGTDRTFEHGDLELLASLGPSMGSALRRGFIAATESHAVEPTPPGVVVLNPDLGLLTWTASARAVDRFPPSVAAVRRMEHASSSRLSRGDAIALASHPNRSTCARAHRGRAMGNDPGCAARG